MLRSLAEEGLGVPAAGEADPELLNHPREIDLIKQLSRLPEEIRLAARGYNPARIGSYVTELAARFHRFYTECRVRGAEIELAKARLLLSDCTRRVIENSLEILGVGAPERM